eukprot:m.74664 g.74664  ORF g.74664 m.74664 type:complete len:304 (-) comp8457_c0_seq12:29-940(-)
MSLSHCYVTNDSQASLHLDKALRLLLRYKPKNPRAFLSLYFDHVVDGIPAVQRAYKLILWGYESPHCDIDSTIAESYSLLSVNQRHTHDRPFGSLQMRRKPLIDGAGGKKRRKSRALSLSKSLNLSESFERMVSNTMMTYPTLAELDASILASVTDMSGCDGVQGMYFMQLLGMLTCDFSPHVSAALSEHFYKRDKSLVTWSHFHQAVKSCLSYMRYLVAARALFAELDQQCTGFASMKICQTIIDGLKSGKDSQMGWIETRKIIMEEKKNSSLVSRNDENEQFVSLADFLRSMSAVYIFSII